MQRWKLKFNTISNDSVVGTRWYVIGITIGETLGECWVYRQSANCNFSPADRQTVPAPV
jgi:hypothetical protein